MKKLLVLVLGAAMLMVFAASAIAAPPAISGDYTLTYDFKGTVDKGEFNLIFSGKMNDEVTYLVRYMVDDKLASGTCGLVVPWMRESYIGLKKSYGKFQFGLWEVKSYSALTGYFENDSALFGRFKAPFTVGFTTNTFFDYFTFAAVYFRDRANERQWVNREAFGDGSYMLTLAFKGSIIKADYNYIFLSNEYKSGTAYVDEFGYTFNISAQLTDWLSVGLYTGLNQQVAQEMKAMIANISFKWGKWSGSFARDFEDGIDAFGGVATDTDPRWGWALQYSFSNALALEYRLRDQLGSTGSNSDKAELRLKLSWK